MAFTDLPRPSLLRLWPLPQIGLFVAQLVHGRHSNKDGDIITCRTIIPADKAWRLGQSYAGMAGIVALPALFAYLQWFHQETGTRRTYYNVFGTRSVEHQLGHWSDLPLDLKILFPLTVILHGVAIVSFIRWLLLRQDLVGEP